MNAPAGGIKFRRRWLFGSPSTRGATEDNRHLIRRDRLQNPSLRDGLLRSHESELRRTFREQDLRGGEEGFCIEALDPRRALEAEISGSNVGDLAETILSSKETLPKGGYVLANGRDTSGSSNDNTVHAPSPASFKRVFSALARRASATPSTMSRTVRIVCNLLSGISMPYFSSMSKERLTRSSESTASSSKVLSSVTCSVEICFAAATSAMQCSAISCSAIWPSALSCPWMLSITSSPAAPLIFCTVSEPMISALTESARIPECV